MQQNLIVKYVKTKKTVMSFRVFCITFVRFLIAIYGHKGKNNAESLGAFLSVWHKRCLHG